MTTDDIRLLYEYDRWANNRALSAASVLSSEEFTRDQGGSFASVRDTLLHIVAGEWGWLEFWKEPLPDSTFLVDLRTRRESLFHTGAFPDVETVRSKWVEVEKEQIEFVDRLTDDVLQRMLPFRGTQVSLAQLMQHLANHSTYHRGQLTLMMRQLKAQPVQTDFHVFLVEGRVVADGR